MENGVQALKMAASMLIFVLAITITISCFTSAVQALNRIFQMQNDEEYVTDADGNYLNFVNFGLDSGTRKVGADTVIPSIYRAYKENYAIYFYNSDNTPMTLYINQREESVNYIDLEKEVYQNAEKAMEHVNKLLYEKSDIFPNGLYQEIKNETFIEKLGEYYMDDLAGETGTSEVNKTKKRVIAYIRQN